MTKVKISTSAKWFFIIFFLITAISVASAYYRFIVLEDYEVFVEYDEEGNLIDVDAEE